MRVEFFFFFFHLSWRNFFLFFFCRHFFFIENRSNIITYIFIVVINRMINIVNSNNKWFKINILIGSRFRYRSTHEKKSIFKHHKIRILHTRVCKSSKRSGTHNWKRIYEERERMHLTCSVAAQRKEKKRARQSYASSLGKGRTYIKVTNRKEIGFLFSRRKSTRQARAVPEACSQREKRERENTCFWQSEKEKLKTRARSPFHPLGNLYEWRVRVRVAIYM